MSRESFSEFKEDIEFISLNLGRILDGIFYPFGNLAYRTGNILGGILLWTKDRIEFPKPANTRCGKAPRFDPSIDRVRANAEVLADFVGREPSLRVCLSYGIFRGLRANAGQVAWARMKRGRSGSEWHGLRAHQACGASWH